VQFSIRTLAPEKTKTGCLVLAVHDAENLAREARTADKAAAGALRRALAGGDLPEKTGSTLLLRGVPGLAAERVLLVRLGERAKYDVTAFRDALRGAATALKGLGAKDAALSVADFAVGGRGLPWAVRNAVLGLRDAFYRFDQLKTGKKPAAPMLSSVTLAIAGAPVTLQAQAALKEAVATADGIDLARTLGNLPPNICTPAYLADEAGKLARGGSTLTQQLAKNLYLSSHKTFLRKAEEALITYALERDLTKKRILELYLNVVEWGKGVYGAEAAARHHFGKHAADLSEEEAALLAAMLPSPRTYDPLKVTRYLAVRQQQILRLMDERQGRPSLTGNKDGTRIVPRQAKENGTPPAPRPVRDKK